MKTIGIIHSLFKEKFSIPRQPGLTSIESKIELIAPFNRKESLTGLSEFSHIWILFIFHQTHCSEKFTPCVRPPRLGGNKKIGVFASRSPNRPNNIGLSLVKLIRIDGTTLIISGGDFLDGTPVLDIKPYLKEIESIPDSKSGWIDSLNTSKLEVHFECECELELKNQIVEILSLDPRPRFHQDGKKPYGSRLGRHDVHWIVSDHKIIVTEII